MDRLLYPRSKECIGDVEMVDGKATTAAAAAAAAAEHALPGPSSLPLRNTPLPSDDHRNSSNSTAKIRKRPAKLALVAAAAAVAGGAPSQRLGGLGNAAAEVGGSGQTSYESTSSSRSMPSSPSTSISGRTGLESVGGAGGMANGYDGRDDLRDALRGAPRRRPSILFPLAAQSNVATSSQAVKTPRLLPTLNIQAARKVAPDTSGRPRNVRIESPGPSAGLPPSVWQDPSEHILSGNGSSLQHARSSYASGPIQVLPGLFLGDEFNACDDAYLVQHGITTILNVAKETTLPCQADDSCRDLGFFQQTNTLARGFGKKLSLFDEAATPTSARHPRQNGKGFASDHAYAAHSSEAAEIYEVCPTPATAATETFFTPATSSFAQQSFVFSPRSLVSPLQTSEDPKRSSLYLRSTSSTPNLQAVFEATKSATSDLPGSYRTDRYSSSSSDEEEDDDDDEMMAEGESAATSSLASHMSTRTEDSSTSSPQYDGQKLSPFDEVSVTTPSSSTFSRRSPATAAASTTCSSSSSAGSFTIALPINAVALSVPPSPMTGRTWPIRYVKLPWTHDETDLANLSSTGGFVTGCAIIADALGIDVRTGRKVNNVEGHGPGATVGGGGGGVLVHCQCGVSRSATLVIAFVMQAAAYEYDFERTRELTGMHDCYEMVKSVSSSISPNISLIYQLVEWERILSRQVAQRNLDAVAEGGFTDDTSRCDTMDEQLTAKSTRTPERRWGKEVMDEEDWMRMRAEEERKEEQAAAEDGQRKLDDVRAREAEWRAAQQQNAASALTNAVSANAKQSPSLQSMSGAAGVGARRKKPSPSLTIVNSSKTNADRLISTLPAQDVSEAPETEQRPKICLLPPPSESEEDADLRPGEMQKSYSEAPPLTPSLTDAALKRTGSERQHKTNNTLSWLHSDRRTSSRPNSGYGMAAFGAMGQSAAERRMKHKRTFSAEVPDWNTIPGSNGNRQPGLVISVPPKRRECDGADRA